MVERNSVIPTRKTDALRRPVTVRYPEQAITLYKKLNMAMPMAPMVDIPIWHALLQPVRSGTWSMHDLARAQLSPDHLEDIGRVTTVIHANKHIPFVVKGQYDAVPTTRREQLRMIATKLLENGMPDHRQNAYAYDQHTGVFVIYPFSFVRGLNGIRKRTYTGALGFMRNIGVHRPTNENPAHRGVVNPGNSERIERFLTDPRWQHESNQFMSMLDAAQHVINPHTLSELAQKQADHYDLGNGGRLGYRMTPQLRHLIGHIRNAVTRSWETFPAVNRVPEEAKDGLLHDMIDSVLPSETAHLV